MLEIDPNLTAAMIWDAAKPYAIPVIAAGVAWLIGKAQAQGGPLAVFFRVKQPPSLPEQKK